MLSTPLNFLAVNSPEAFTVLRVESSGAILCSVVWNKDGEMEGKGFIEDRCYIQCMYVSVLWRSGMEYEYPFCSGTSQGLLCQRGQFSPHPLTPFCLLLSRTAHPEPILRNPTLRAYMIFLTLQAKLDWLGKISNVLSPRILVAGLFSGNVSKVLVKDISYELLLFIRSKKYFIY